VPVHLAPTFYPSSTSFTDAQSVRLESARELEGLDIHIRLTPSLRVAGRVSGSDGRPAGRARFVLVPSTPYVSTDSLGIDTNTGAVGAYWNAASGSTGADGSFVTTGLAAGAYTLFVRGAAAAGSPLTQWANVPVTLGDHDVEGLSVVLQPGLSISGHVSVAEGTPPDLARLKLSLLGTPGGETTVSVMGASVDSSGAFAISGLTPGKYVLTASGLPAPWTSGTVSIGDRDVTDLPFELAADGLKSDVAVSITTRAAELTGALTNGAGSPATGFYMIVFPADHAYWVGRTRRIQALRPGTDGRFDFKDLPAGRYRLAATTDVEPGEWFDPAFLQTIESRSVPVLLEAGQALHQDLKLGGG
jgi:hypothetical protein